jgi:hypothetical protein
LHSPTRDEYRQIFEAVAKSHGLGLTDEIFEFVIDSLNGRFDLAYYQPGFICEQVIEACKAFNLRPELKKEMVAEASTNALCQKPLHDFLPCRCFGYVVVNCVPCPNRVGSLRRWPV